MTIQFNSKTSIISQGAVLLWSWQARKKYIKLREQYNKNNNTNKRVMTTMTEVK